MFRRRRGGSLKYHYTVKIDCVTMRDDMVCPPGFQFAVAWRSGGKVAVTHVCTAQEAGVAVFDAELAMVCSIYRDAASGPRGSHFVPKEASFTLLQCREGKALS